MNLVSKNDAQLILYFKKVIYNAATNYYKKKQRYQNNECLLDSIENALSCRTDCSIVSSQILIFDTKIYFENDGLSQCIEKLSQREKMVLVEKFVNERTDREIGEILGITRQGVTNLKHRIYSKIKERIASKLEE